MHHRQDINHDLRELITTQRGIVRSDQAAELGLGNRAMSRLVDQGHWVRLTRGLFDAAPLGDDFEKQAWAALLAGGDRAAIGGEAALRLYGLDRQVEQIEVWVPPLNQPESIPGVLVRRDFLGRTVRARGLLTRIPVEDAIVDVGQYLPTDQLVSLLTDATRQRLATLQRITATVRGRHRVRGRDRFDDLLADLNGIESTLEFAYLRDVERAHGLPIGLRNVSVSSGTRTDVHYVEYGVLVELDGRRGHHDANSTFRDLNRDNRHVLIGKPTLRYGSVDVRGRSCQVARQVGGLLAGRGWAGPFQTCPRCRLVPVELSELL